MIMKHNIEKLNEPIRRGDAIEAIRRERNIYALMDVPAVELPAKVVVQVNVDTDEIIDRIKEGYNSEPTCGKWITTRTWLHDGEPYCNQCGFAPFDERDVISFCPFCGAKMSKE